MFWENLLKSPTWLMKPPTRPLDFETLRIPPAFSSYPHFIEIVGNELYSFGDFGNNWDVWAVFMKMWGFPET